MSDLEITPQLQQNKLKRQRNAITQALTSRVRPRSQLTADWFKASHVPGSRLNDAKAFIGPTVPKNKHPLSREMLRVSLMWKNSNKLQIKDVNFNIHSLSPFVILALGKHTKLPHRSSLPQVMRGVALSGSCS